MVIQLRSGKITKTKKGSNAKSKDTTTKFSKYTRRKLNIKKKKNCTWIATSFIACNPAVENMHIKQNNWKYQYTYKNEKAIRKILSSMSILCAHGQCWPLFKFEEGTTFL